MNLSLCEQMKWVTTRIQNDVFGKIMQVRKPIHENFGKGMT